jgi:signal transduction histidine kinase
MPVRLRITLLFVALVFIILAMVCTGIYYFSYTARVNTIKQRLTNRGITTARLLSQREVFDKELIRRIDSLTTISLKNKTVQAYDYRNKIIYRYTDQPNDVLAIDDNTLNETRVRGSLYFEIGNKEAVAYHYTDNNARIVIVTAAEDEEGKASLKSLRNILLLSFLVGNMFVLVSGYFFSSRLLLPIKRIASDMAEISAQNLERRIETGETKDEWYQLATTLNSVLNRLQESFELQTRFLSNASHELSTPLTSISSQVEIILQRERTAEAYRNALQSIGSDVHHMAKLTQTLLEFAKASGSAGGLEITLIRIDEVLLNLPAEITRINPDYNVVIDFENLPEQEDQLLVFGNEALLTSAIRNLVMNACKYSNDQKAMLTLNAKSDKIVISVKDEGKGIPEEELQNIFQPFYRIGGNTAKGFGLGLSLVDRIIKIHKGKISIHSEVNKGTEIIIEFPSARSLGAGTQF